MRPDGQQDYEKLGLFYLGRGYDLDARARRADLVLYDSSDLVTHAVCVGMTGSGKTGLCLALLEEAAIDGIPAIAIDPKGDLANLLLQFPALRASDFEPWIDADEARRNGVTPTEWAQRAADAARRGLADWDQTPERIQKLADSAEFVVYTPGSTAGLSLSILRSFAAPPPEIVDDSEAFHARVAGTATSLLGLLGVDADPLQSREHILLANLLDGAWRAGRDLDLAALIGLLQSPPIQRIGVLELEAFFPAKDRFALAMRLNNLLASPAFATWMEGEPLDIGKLLWNAQGKPRIVILSIAHLSDQERMFFVSLVLNETLTWMRTQRGTSSLRALLYMDEIFGYFPPVANPPSKTALLTLLKQARAFGLGIVLATQNPVDLDYKGLSNCGTWFVGRLQTERDKARLLDGLEGAAAQASGGFDRARMEQALSALGKRVFLMNNVHEKAPRIFETRQVLSYLRGPMTRAEIKTLMAPWKPPASSRAVAASTVAPAPSRSFAAAATTLQATHPTVAPSPATTTAVPAERAHSGMAIETSALSSAAPAKHPRPVLPPEINERFLPVRVPPPVNARLVYEPGIYGKALLYIEDKKLGVDAQSMPIRFAALAGLSVHWEQASKCAVDEGALESSPSPNASFAPLPPEACKPKSYETWKKQFVDALFREERLELWKCASLGRVSAPGESERDFRLRLGDEARVARDLAKERLRQRFAPKFEALEEKLRRARQTIDREAAQAKDSQVGGALSFGASLLGAFLGRKTVSATNVGRVASAARSVSRMQKESADVGRAEENSKALQKKLSELAAELEAEVAASAAGIDPLREPLDTLVLRPKKSNVSARVLTLAWAPTFVMPGGERLQAW